MCDSIKKHYKTKQTTFSSSKIPVVFSLSVFVESSRRLCLFPKVKMYSMVISLMSSETSTSTMSSYNFELFIGEPLTSVILSCFKQACRLLDSKGSFMLKVTTFLHFCSVQRSLELNTFRLLLLSEKQLCNSVQLLLVFNVSLQTSKLHLA